jgi:hypothetical protein
MHILDHSATVIGQLLPYTSINPNFEQIPGMERVLWKNPGKVRKDMVIRSWNVLSSESI